MSGNAELDQVRKMQIRNTEHENKERSRRSTLNEQAILHHNIITLAKSSFPRENYEKERSKSTQNTQSRSERSLKRRADIEAKRAVLEPTQIEVPSKVHYVDVFPPENNNTQPRERVSTQQVLQFSLVSTFCFCSKSLCSNFSGRFIYYGLPNMISLSGGSTNGWIRRWE